MNPDIRLPIKHKSAKNLPPNKNSNYQEMKKFLKSISFAAKLLFHLEILLPYIFPSLPIRNSLNVLT